MAMDKKNKKSFSPDVMVFKEAAKSGGEASVLKMYEQNISCTLEGVIARALATTASFFCYRDYDIAEQGRAFEKIKSEPIVDFFEHFKPATSNISEEGVAELVNRAADARYKKHDGVLPIMMFIGELILNYKIDIDEHLKLYFSYSEK